MDTILIFAEILIFLFGIVIGSFLNVCIYRIPKGEDIVKVNSHCMTCGYQLKWYDLIPIFSYIFLDFCSQWTECREWDILSAGIRIAGA